MNKIKLFSKSVAIMLTAVVPLTIFAACDTKEPEEPEESTDFSNIMNLDFFYDDGEHVNIVDYNNFKENFRSMSDVMNEGDIFVIDTEKSSADSIAVDILRKCNLTVTDTSTDTKYNVLMMGGTVEDVLTVLNIKIADGFGTNFDLDTMLEDGMEIVIKDKQESENEHETAAETETQAEITEIEETTESATQAPETDTDSSQSSDVSENSDISSDSTSEQSGDETQTTENTNEITVIFNLNGKQITVQSEGQNDFKQALGKIESELTEDDVLVVDVENSAVNAIAINVLKKCTVTVDDTKTNTKYTAVLIGGIVEEALAALNVEIADGYVVNYDSETSIEDQMEIVISEKERETKPVETPTATPTQSPPATEAPATSSKTIVNTEIYEDCDGSGHGVKIIHYSDGTQEEVYF